ncbi:MAG: tyrosine-type recombinase/integrase [Treponema sp.]|nr:tyrosine-type recombinase/integrase [Treponema sp.]
MSRDETQTLSLKEAVGEYILYIRTVRSYSVNTVTGYSEDFKHLFAVVPEDMPINQVDVMMLRNCIAKLSRKKYSVTSINRFIAACRGLFAYCKKFGYLESNVTLELKTLKTPKHLPKFMTQAEVDELCLEPEKKELLWEKRDKALFEMLYSSGCRVGEIANLCITDLTADHSSAVVVGKGQKSRRVFFEEDARKALDAYLKDRDERFPEASMRGGATVEQVFLSQKGLPLTEHGIWYIVSRYTGAEGSGRHLSPHAFRHTFATAMLSGGADIRSVQEMLGHSSISTTQRYTHVTTARLKEVYAQAFPHSGKKD